MSAPNLSRLNTSARRVGDVLDIIVAQRIVAICKAGPIVAMHFSTPQGIIVVRMPATDFVEKTHRERDSNGNPFVMPLVPLEQDAADTTPKRAPMPKPNGQIL